MKHFLFQNLPHLFFTSIESFTYGYGFDGGIWAEIFLLYIFNLGRFLVSISCLFGV